MEAARLQEVVHLLHRMPTLTISVRDRVLNGNEGRARLSNEACMQSTRVTLSYLGSVFVIE